MERNFPPIPSGWFTLTFSNELERGQVVPLRAFDRDLVLFRSESGVARLFDAHCPHLGAHLGHGGVVEGESVRCPFHHWRFGGDGRCVEVPGCDRIPPKARVHAWDVREQDGLVMAWFHPEGAAPTFEVPALEGEGWTEIKTVRWRIASHPQEINENTVDTAHMQPIHHTGTSRVSEGPIVDRASMRVVLSFVASGEIIGMEGDNDVELDVTMHGLGYIIARAWIKNVDLHARYSICCTPIDRETTEILGALSMQDTGDSAFTQEAAELFFEAYTKDFVKDFPIWENKVYRERPVLSGADGPIGMFRRWSRQFYAEQSATATSRTATERRPPVRRRERLRDALIGARELLHRVKSTLPIGLGARAARSERDEEPEWVAPPPPSGAPVRETTTAPASAAAVRKVQSIEQYFATLHERFVPAASSGIDAVFQWEIAGDGGGTYHAVVRDGEMRLADGPHARPTVTIAMNADEYVQVVNGERDGPRAFTVGSGRVSGKLRLAMKMRQIFPIA